MLIRHIVIPLFSALLITIDINNRKAYYYFINNHMFAFYTDYYRLSALEIDLPASGEARPEAGSFSHLNVAEERSLCAV